MHAEDLKHKPIGAVAGIFITLGIVFGILFCVFWINFLQFVLKISWLTIVLYGVLIVAAFFIIKRLVLEYIYLIEKDRITFGRRIGKREKELLFVPFREILSFGPYAEMQDKIDTSKRRFKYTFKKKVDWYVINCTGCTVILSPTQEYIDCLKQVKHRRRRSDCEDPHS